MIKHLYLLFLICLTAQLYAQKVVVIKDEDVEGGLTEWTNDNEYHLDGYVFVEPGGTLTIEAGTVIKGLLTPSTGDQSSALIVARGAEIYAEGTAEEPINFTAEFDDVSDPDDLTKDDKGLWGGVLILGSATVGIDGGTTNVEGIPTIEGRAEYGGNDDRDNSGVLRYVSIRHGGSKLEANNEINGLTLGGVGSATVIDFVEVYANLDDGIEWFGGAVNVKHAAVSFCGDDSYDYDQSWDGKGQFWFTLQDELSNRAGEWDGSEAANLGPKVVPVISNATFIGAGGMSLNPDNNDALRIRDDAAVNLHNSVLAGFARDGIRIDNNGSGADSWDRFEAGDILFNNNVFWDFGGGSTLLDIIGTEDSGDAELASHLENNGNVYANPELAGICRSGTNCLDPRPNGSGSAYGKAVAVGDPFFEDVSYIGAFDSESDLWLEGWTALHQSGILADAVSSVDDPVLSEIDEKMRVYPNPVENEVIVVFELSQPESLRIQIVDMLGRLVRNVEADQDFTSGKYEAKVNVSQLQSGTYLVTLSSEEGVIGRRVIIKN